MFHTVIFDFDMTLVDSSYAIRDTMNRLAELRGLAQVTREQVLAVIGLPIRESWVKVWGSFEEEWLTDFRAFFLADEFAGIHPFPGTLPLLEALALRGTALGIASNRQQPAHPLKATGLEKYFSTVVGMGDVPLGKPAPDMILKCMADLACDRSSTLFVGDTLDDIIAARDAGVRSVGLTTGNARREDLLAAGAWRVIDSLEELLPLLDEEEERYGEQNRHPVHMTYDPSGKEKPQ